MIRLGLMISLVCFVLTVVFSTIGWLNTPDGATVPTQVNFSGQPTTYGSKMEAFLYLPFILAGITFLLSLAPSIDPRGKNVRRSRPLYLVAWVIGMVTITGAQGLTSWLALGGELDARLFAQGLAIFIAAIMLVLGLVIARARPNFFAGIRTPWTLSSDLSWDKTHRMASRVYLVLGVLGLISAFVLPPQNVTIGLIALLLVSTLGLIIYSFIIWKNDPARETLNPDDAD